MGNEREHTRTALRVIADEHRALGEWRPEQASTRDELIQALKAIAAAVQDWEALDDAVDQEISDQRHWVEWWGEHVSVRESAGGNQFRSNADLRSTINRDDAEAESGISQQKTFRWRRYLNGDITEYRVLLRGPSWRKAMQERTDQRGASGTGENEWFTPPEFIALARQVMGAIDLDPATHELAQETIQATRYFTKADDGLRHEWHGRVWLNPPYATELIPLFIAKLLEERLAGRVTTAILLTHNYTDVKWFQRMTEIADAFCFTRGRVKFYDPLNSKIAPCTQGQVFTYFGDDVSLFASVFADVGFVVAPWRSRTVQ
jgi:phage N-6-adenine-methyltransferase